MNTNKSIDLTIVDFTTVKSRREIVGGCSSGGSSGGG